MVSECDAIRCGDLSKIKIQFCNKIVSMQRNCNAFWPCPPTSLLANHRNGLPSHQDPRQPADILCSKANRQGYDLCWENLKYDSWVIQFKLMKSLFAQGGKGRLRGTNEKNFRPQCALGEIKKYFILREIIEKFHSVFHSV